MKKIIKSFFKILPDNIYIMIKYFYHFKRLPNLNKPVSFNEKLQWLKIHNRNELYVKMADKYEVKRIIAEKVGEQYVIKNYGVWESFDDICFDSLPRQFVLKTTHDCGGVVICKDKTKFDYNKARKILEKHLRYNYFYEGREWPYKEIKPRIIAEAYLENQLTNDLRDYKVLTFNGKAKLLYVATDRQNKNEEVKFDFYDMDFNHLDIINGHPNSQGCIQKPKTLNEMRILAELLSDGIPHLRVDFYEVDGNVYIGELTFFHLSGMVPFTPEKWDYILGSWLKLPLK